MEVESNVISATTPLSIFIANLLIIMVVTGHLADRSGVPKHIIKLIIIIIFSLSLLLYISGSFTLIHDVISILQNNNTSLRSTSGISQFCREVHTLATTKLIQVLLLLSVVYLLLQTLCIPGTIALNAAAGAVLGTPIALLFCTLLGTLGASCCYYISNIIGIKLVERVDAKLMKGKGLSKIRTQVTRHRAELFIYLLFLRLTPILPNWLVNLASPVVGVPLRVFAFATFIGIIPQTYLTVRFGAIARINKTQNEGIVTVWDTLLLAVLGTAVLGAFYLKKRFNSTNVNINSNNNNSNINNNNNSGGGGGGLI